MKKTLPNDDLPTPTCRYGQPWCTTRHDERPGQDCSSDIYSIRGVNVGTGAGLWVTDEDTYAGCPAPAVLSLVERGDAPGTTLYLDATGLRELASVATRLADAIEGDAES